MANMAVLKPLPQDNNPITLLLMRKGKARLLSRLPAPYSLLTKTTGSSVMNGEPI